MIKFKLLLVLVCLSFGILLIDSCKKDPTLPVLTTTTVSEITINSFTSGGSITSSGGADITARGVCYSTSQNPTISGTHTTDGKGSGSFSSEVTGLTPNTKYYVRAYATNSAGTAYGNEVNCTTTALVVPTLTTTDVSAISLTTATSGGNISSDGGASVTERGVCWATTANPTIDDNVTSDGTGTGTFVSDLTSLTPSTTYHVRAYATNSVGTAYGNDVSFTTTALAVPTVTTVATVTSITLTTAVSGGEVTSNGGADVTVRGVCWATTANPVVTGAKTTDGAGNGSFTSNLADLTPGTTYHVRAYATNSVGTGYGADVQFETTPIGLATLTTKEVTSIGYTTAVSGGDISDTGGGAITAKGVCWSTTALPLATGSHTTDGTGTASFTSNMASLLSGTEYHVRAYATNSAGTAYGNERTFTTTAVVLPTLTTTAITLLTTTTVHTGGNITSAGGGTITARGVCWSTSPDPTVDDDLTSNGTGSGIFTSDPTGLTPGTDYYLRAYATNSAGTAYGNQVTFTTVAIVPPTVTTTAFTALTATTVTSGGNVTDDGNGDITARGVCYATTTAPTIANSVTTNGTGTGVFTSNLTGLTPNTTYYLRAYATNSNSTSYGSEITFTTFAATDFDGNNYTSVVIGTQTWLAQNLKTTSYRNGDPIGTTVPATLDITAEVSPKYQWAVNNDVNNVAVYGRFYTWFAVTDSRNVCPVGYHVPSDAEWETLKTFLGGEAVAGGKIKEIGTTHWQTPNTGATNDYGFTAVAGGYRNFNGSFVSFSVSSPYWSATENSTNPAWGWGQGLYYNSTILLRGGFDKPDGCVVRCIKD